MGTAIYYFTGTGNSLAVARDLAGRTEARLLSMASAVTNASATCDAEALGLVFPVYHKSIPLIVQRFVEQAEGLAGKYLFCVCTYGDTLGFAVRDLGRIVRARGGELAGGFGVHMPYNYVTPSLAFKGFLKSFKMRVEPVEKQQALFATSREKVASIAAYVNARSTGTFETLVDPITRLADRFGLPETLGKAVWLKVGGVEEEVDLPFIESRQLMDRAFFTDENCNGCRICARICPVNNVALDGERPLWQHRCEQCFACLQWCPQEAIQFSGKTSEGARYHHPEVKLADMLQQPPERAKE